jgi:hypothetical protein
MKSLDYTLQKLPGNPLELPNSSLPLGNPQPILQQTKSKITTNPFIKEAPDNTNYNEINKKVSATFMSVLEELFNKPTNESWNSYLLDVFKKEDRLNYIGILLFFIALYILLIK